MRTRTRRDSVKQQPYLRRGRSPSCRAGLPREERPVAYVSYDFDESLSGFVNAWAALVSVASAIPLVAIGIVFVMILRRMR